VRNTQENASGKRAFDEPRKHAGPLQRSGTTQKGRKKMKHWKILAGAAATLALAYAPASAQQTINITAVSGYSPTASWVKVFKEYFIPEVNKRLAGKN
jgi:hypothetical protein